MRSTRATAAVARLNGRSEGKVYQMVIQSGGRFALRQQGVEPPLVEGLELDDFVAFVNAQGPQEVRRVTKNDAAFARQLVKKPKD